MRTSTFPRYFRIYDHDTKIMYYPEQLLQMKIGITATGNIIYGGETRIPNGTIQWFTGQRDQNNVPLYEGDICKVGVQNEFGSMSEHFGVMRWMPERTMFVLNVIDAKANKMFVTRSCLRVGDEFSNEDLMKLVNGK